MAHDYRAIADKVYDIFNRGAVDELDSAFAPGFVDHEELPGVSGNGIELPKAFVQMSHQGFPDFHMEVLHVIGEGDMACAHFRLTGTHGGEFMGIPATGRSVDIEGIDLVKLSDSGQITEHWGVSQEMQMMRQLGLIPESAPAT
jgi:predicted ester cyclase